MSSSSVVKYKHISGDQSDHKLLRYVANQFHLTPLQAAEIRCKRTCKEVCLPFFNTWGHLLPPEAWHHPSMWCNDLLLETLWWRVEGDILKLLAICALFTSASILFATVSCTPLYTFSCHFPSTG